MNNKIIKLLEQNKNKLHNRIAHTPQSEYSSYLELVKMIVEEILNISDYDYKHYDVKNISVIDNGDWQGT